MRELQRGLWWWEAVHPEWTPEDAATEDWGPEVSSYAIDDGEQLLVFDPTTPPSPVDDLAGNRETVVVLTCPWHERDTRRIVERFGASVFVPPCSAQIPRSAAGRWTRVPRRSRSSSGCVRCSSCPWSLSSRRTGHRPTEPLSSARSLTTTRRRSHERLHRDATRRD